MLELIEGYYAHFFLMLLFVIGLYAMMMKKNLIKKIFGMSMIQSAAILFWILVAYKERATVPILDPNISLKNPDM
ncbi:NADH-quinone oxidoreductase subunit K, partial [Desulfonatronospira sp.]|uniref:NADH-quinone oxidoreductase subunit K n=1 Tax=Desulfonatronospira sp. TaxID=1962951 RepID=UPI0025BC3064